MLVRESASMDNISVQWRTKDISTTDYVPATKDLDYVGNTGTVTFLINAVRAIILQIITL